MAQLKEKPKRICYKILTTEQTEVSASLQVTLQDRRRVLGLFSFLRDFIPGADDWKEKRCLQSFQPQKKQTKEPVYVSLCLCALEQWIRWPIFVFVFQICIRVFDSLDLLWAFFFFFFFFCESSVGMGAVWVDLPDLILIFYVLCYFGPIEKCKVKSEQLIEGMWGKKNKQFLAPEHPTINFLQLIQHCLYLNYHPV